MRPFDKIFIYGTYIDMVDFKNISDEQLLTLVKQRDLAEKVKQQAKKLKAKRPKRDRKEHVRTKKLSLL